MKCPDDGCDCRRSDCLVSGCVRCKAPASEVAPEIELPMPALPRLPDLPAMPGIPDIAASIARNEHALLIEVAPYALRGIDMAIAAAAIQDNKLDTSELEALKAKLQFWLAPGNALVGSVR